MREKDFLQQVIDLARLTGWRVYHTHDSRRSAAGFPDIIAVRGERVVAAELKVNADLTYEQRDWLRLLAETGKAEVFCWRPSHWKQIESVLS